MAAAAAWAGLFARRRRRSRTEAIVTPRGGGRGAKDGWDRRASRGAARQDGFGDGPERRARAYWEARAAIGVRGPRREVRARRRVVRIVEWAVWFVHGGAGRDGWRGSGRRVLRWDWRDGVRGELFLGSWEMRVRAWRIGASPAGEGGEGGKVGTGLVGGSAVEG